MLPRAPRACGALGRYPLRSRSNTHSDVCRDGLQLSSSGEELARQYAGGAATLTTGFSLVRAADLVSVDVALAAPLGRRVAAANGWQALA